MKLSRSLVGKQVRISWRDPRTLRVTSHDTDGHRDVIKGRAALAEWNEWGLVECIDEGVLFLQQSIGIDPPKESDQQHELQYSVVPEELIERVVILVDQPEQEGKV